MLFTLESKPSMPKNPMSRFMLWAVLVFALFMGIVWLTGWEWILDRTGRFILLFFSITGAIWAGYGIKIGVLSVVHKNGTMSTYTRKKQPVRFYFLAVVYFGFCACLTFIMGHTMFAG
ncbi:MAG: hypothetical protein AAF420_16545 [Pseudomonadota bacterium]